MSAWIRRRGPGVFGSSVKEREFVIDNLLVRIHFIIVMIRWTGLAPWEFEFPFPGSLTSTFLLQSRKQPTRELRTGSRTGEYEANRFSHLVAFLSGRREQAVPALFENVPGCSGAVPSFP